MSTRGAGWWLLVVLAAAVSAPIGCPAPATLNLGITNEEHTQAYFPISGKLAGTDVDVPHKLGKATHTGPMSCGSCHGGTVSFSVAKCIECHQNDDRPVTQAHAQVAGFLPVNTACLQCHPDGLKGSELGVAQHSITHFPIDEGDAHGGAAYQRRIAPGQNSCSACHASPSPNELVLCAECHANDETPLVDTHAAVASSFEGANTSCKECHAETPLHPEMDPARHGGYGIDHYGAICANCHQARRGPPKEWAVDFAVFNCTGCHNHPSECSPTAPPGTCCPNRPCPASPLP